MEGAADHARTGLTTTHSYGDPPQYQEHNFTDVKMEETVGFVTSHGDEEKEEVREERETWSGRLDFLVSCVGFAVGLGNVWRFPYLCYKNGGGAFLIPYVIFVALSGIPIFLLEISLGQFMKQGGIGMWNLCPLMKGIGYSSTVIVFYCNCYYIMVLTWAMYYFYRSLTDVLPWGSCNNVWNTPQCVDNTNITAATNLLLNKSISVPGFNSSVHYKSSVDEFWEREVLQISKGITEVGSIRLELAICLFLAWFICYICICKGIKTTGKIVYFTALFPYLVLLTFVVRGLTLPGSIEGVKYYLTPNFTKLQESQVWVDAGTQVFFSYAVGLGALPALGSYNKYHNNCIRDSAIIALVNSFTSFLAGFVVFSFLGFMSNERKIPIKSIATSGPGLAFIVYPKAVTSMPIAPFWSCLFFFMIFLLGLDSQFVGVEGFLTALIDLYPKYLKKRRVKFAAVVCLVFFLVGLTMITEGGMYVFQIFDYYSASGMTLLWLAAWESITVAWLFGVNRYMRMLEDMVGYRPSAVLKWCWLIFTPGLALAVLVYSIVTYTPLTYNKTYHYPKWAIGVGLSLALSSMICIPIGAAVTLWKTPGNTIKERFRASMRPIWGSHQKHLMSNTRKEEDKLANFYKSWSSDNIIMPPTTSASGSDEKSKITDLN